MTTILAKMREQGLLTSSDPNTPPAVRSVHVEYNSLPVDISDDFLAPLPDLPTIEIKQIDFENALLPEYKGLYAVVLDNVVSQKECDELIRMAEMSTGAHGNSEQDPENNGWRPALVRAGVNREVAAFQYRNSDRIVWDEAEVARRLLNRVLQAKGMKEYLSNLSGEKYYPVIGEWAAKREEKWVIAGLNGRMRFLKYGPGQYFREHCDGP